MAFIFFTVPIEDSGRVQEELNAFLRSHKVLSVDRGWVEQVATALVAFARSAGVSSWRFRTGVLQELAVSGQRARTG
jgi:hypothetical protein